MHHTIVNMRHRTVPGLAIPVPFLATPGTSPKPLATFVDYCVSNSAYSSTTHRHVAKALGLLWDHQIQTAHLSERRDPNSIIPSAKFKLDLFCNHLKRGTITTTAQGQDDDTGLYWSPCPSLDLLKTLGFSIERFLDYLRINDRFADPDVLFDIVPTDGRKFLESTFAAVRVTGFSFLKHLTNGDSKQPQKNRRIFANVIGKDDRSYRPAPTKRFPSELLVPFLGDGFKTAVFNPLVKTACDETGRMFAHLLLAGSRRSEPLHLWTNDLHVFNDELTVFLRHPQLFFEGNGRDNREVILNRTYKMLPRNLRSDKHKAGWKALLLDHDQSAQMHFLPLIGLQERLVSLYHHYAQNVRIPVMRARRLRGLPDHPYFLVSTSSMPHQDVNIGDPYTMAAAIESWRRAFHRTVQDASKAWQLSKYSGTTMHGLRHLYGHTLAALGHDAIFIQRAMHHKNILSSRVYTMPTDTEVNVALQAANTRALSEGVLPNLPTFRSTGELLDELVKVAVGEFR